MWHTNASYCGASASEQWGHRRLREKHKEPADPKSNQLHPLDGVGVWVSDVDLGDDSFDLGGSPE